MNIPNIPTDSLYKFLFLGALLMGIFGQIYPEIRYNELEREEILLKEEVDNLNLQHLLFKSEMKRFEKYVNSIDGNYSFEYQDSMIIYSRINHGVIISKEDQLLIDEINLNVQKFNQQQTLRNQGFIKIKTKAALINKEYELLNFWCKVANVCIILSIIFGCIGLYKWYKLDNINHKTITAKYRLLTNKKGICQSCGMDINNDANISDTFAKYCSFCYKENNFNHNMTFDEFSELVNNRLSELKWSKRKIAKHITAMKKLNRWNNDFRWS